MQSECEEIMDLASDNGWFDTSFIESVLRQLYDGKELSSKQISAVERIYAMVTAE